MSEGDTRSWLPGGLRPGPAEPVAADPAAAEPVPGEPVTAELATAGEPGLLRRRGLRLPGSPERRSRALPVLVVLALVLGVVAGVVARGFISPAQVAANAKAPKASLITARVRYGVLAVPVNMRANVGDGNPVQIGAPSDLSGSLAVVTSVDVRSGQQVGQGQLLGTVAERPAFVFGGVIPVFRTMAPGVRGSDVKELQAGLAAAGYGLGSDPSGSYGPGTAAAVAALYKAHGLKPAFAGTPGQVSRATGQVTAARQSLSAAQAKLAADQGGRPSVLAADRAAVASAEHQLSAAERALAVAQRTTGAEIPMGEVVFVAHLPARVLSVDKLGATVGSSSGSGGSGGGFPQRGGQGKTSSSFVQLGSGKVTLTGFAPGIQTRLLRAGMTGTAISDLSGARFGVRISSIRGSQVVFVPTGRVPGGVVNQNVQVTLTASKVQSFLVPVAAVSTAGSGQAYLTLSVGGGQTKSVPVRLEVSSGGLQAVSPVHPGSLRAGDLVVLGIGSAK